MKKLPEKTYLDIIRDYGRGDLYPFHMPGHKRNTKRFGDDLNFSMDMTESYGVENLFKPGDFLKGHLEEMAKLYGSQKSYYTINGSSGGILSAIHGTTWRRDRILMARNAHKSAYHAIEICDLNPVFFLPEVYAPFEIYGSVNPETVEKLLIQYPDTRLVMITSPTFEGIISDVKTIAEICHKHDALLMVDQAHGAHFQYTEHLPTALSQGADLVIESLHKTLPSLTSTSLLHISDRVDAHRIEHSLSVFQTTSPSHLLIASIDQCFIYLKHFGKKEHKKLYKRLDAFYDNVRDLKNLKVLDEIDETVYKIDSSKIVISTKAVNMSGQDLMTRLREDYKIEMEMAYGNYAMAIATIGDKEEGFIRLRDALRELDGKVSRIEGKKNVFPDIPTRKLFVAEAMEGSKEWVPVKESLNRTAAEYAWAYPPGIPLVTPGEVIDESILNKFEQLESQGIPIQTDTKKTPELIRVRKQN